MIRNHPTHHQDHARDVEFIFEEFSRHRETLDIEALIDHISKLHYEMVYKPLVQAGGNPKYWSKEHTRFMIVIWSCLFL